MLETLSSTDSIIDSNTRGFFMDLMSANRNASWNPLTSLITFESEGYHRDITLSPTVQFTLNEYSTILHELTHLWCARTSRLGWLFSKVATDAFLKWQNNTSLSVSVPESVRSLLCAFTPLLEG